MKHFLLLSLISFSSLSTIAMEVVPCSSKDDVRLLLDSQKQRVYVEDENAAYRVENYDMNPLMRKLVERGALTKFTQEDGYVRINKVDDPNQLSKYALAAKVRGNGGGPGAAWFSYWTVKVGAYTGILLGAKVANIVCPGGGTVATGFAVAAAGGAPAIAASIEAAAIATYFAVLPLPTP